MEERRIGYQITVFVFNILTTMHWKGLWASRQGGGSFHPGEKKAKVARDLVLSTIWVKLARFKERRHIWRKEEEEGENERNECDEMMDITWDNNTSDYRRKVETSLRKENQSKVVQDHIEDEHLWRLQECLVGEVASLYEMRIIEDRVVRMGLGEISVKRIQGLQGISC
ncbi:hypothetical protein J1N35_045656 [Gossypium stocksii]|uniref:Uncharacterized protein n=1 Tax=Gossypium stocksii TaxID=47602 RepID=A0A9D3UBZ9_9ROSI|nr:hypothetical protein J1N35_045656 [Gossypium stocksii]